MFRCALLYVQSSMAIILMGKRELIALLNWSSWCLMMVERLFLALPRGCLQFVIVVFPDQTHLLFLNIIYAKMVLAWHSPWIIQKASSLDTWSNIYTKILSRKIKHSFKFILLIPVLQQPLKFPRCIGQAECHAAALIKANFSNDECRLFLISFFHLHLPVS